MEMLKRGNSICTDMDTDTALVKIKKEIVHDSLCIDTDTATDVDTETFILIRPCGDLCHTVWVSR